MLDNACSYYLRGEFMKFLKTSVLLSMGLMSLSLWAGPSVGGGGDVVILPDDSVVLADPYIDSGAPQPNNMPPLRALNPRILQVINLYQKASASLVSDFSIKGKSDIGEALKLLAMRNNDLRFYGVQTTEELNQFCAPGGRKIYKLPSGAQVQQVACTAGNETFMVEPLFMRLSLRDQGLLLIHERLTTLRDQHGGKNYSAIARFTTGLNIYLTVLNEQNKKKFRSLTNDEQKLLSDFFIAIEEIEKRNTDITDDSFQWVVHQNGGGRVHANSVIDESAFISLNSVIVKGSEVANDTRVINFSNPYRLVVKMEEGAVIDNLANTFTYNNNNDYVPTAKSIIKLKSNAKIQNVRIVNNQNLFTFGENVSIADSVIDSTYFSVGSGSVVKNSIIDTSELTLGDSVTMSNATISYGQLKTRIASNEQLVDKSILQSTYETYYPLGFIPQALNVTLNVPTFECTQSTKLERKKTEWKKEFLNASKDGAIVTGEILLAGQTGIFKPVYKYSYNNVKLKLMLKNFVKDSNSNLFMINDQGRIVSPEYKRASLKVNFEGMRSCEAKAIYNSSGAFQDRQGSLILHPVNIY